MKKNYFVWVFILIGFWGFSQDGSPDLSFGNNGIVETDFGNDWDSSMLVTTAPSGTIFVTAEAASLYPNDKIIISYLPNGSINNSFGTNGVWNDANFQDSYLKILTTGEDLLVLTTNSSGDFILIKLLANGTLDTAFGNSGELVVATGDQIARDFIVLENNNILVLGKETGGGISQLVLKRFLPNGNLDTAFATNGVAVLQVADETNSPSRLVTDNTGMLFISGKFKNTGENTFNGVVKVSSSGVADADYGTNSIAQIPADNNYSCGKIGVLSNGSIIAYCDYADNVNEIIYSYTYKLSALGFQDTSFGNNGFIDNYGLGDVLIQENDRIVIVDLGWDFFEGGGILTLTRFHQNGQLDATFQFQHNFSELGSLNAAFQPDGKIIATGGSMWYNGDPNIIVFRYNNTVLGVDDVSGNEIFVYPNPASNQINIKGLTQNNLPYSIFDVTGKKVQTGVLLNQETTLDISALQQGIYLFKTPRGIRKIIKK